MSLLAALFSVSRPLRTPVGRAVAALSATQIISWGTTYYLPALLAHRMASDLGLSRTVIFSGITVMLLVMAALSPLTGRLLSRHGARPVMMAGSTVIALGLLLLAMAGGVSGYILAWATMGVGGAFGLSQAASTALVQIAPSRARASIGIVSLVSGLSSTASWPLVIWLDGTIGWRATVAVFAAIHVTLGVALHAIGLANARPREAAGGRGASDEIPGTARHPRSAFALSAAAFSIAGLLSWGIPLNLIDLMRHMGHAETAAVVIGAVFGVAQLVARLCDLAVGRRIDHFRLGLAMMALVCVSLLVFMLGGDRVVVAVLFVLGFGIAAGWIAILRAILPLHLFGSAAYATVVGRISVPQNLAFAAAPVMFSAVAERWNFDALLAVVLALSGIALAFMAVLAWREG